MTGRVWQWLSRSHEIRLHWSWGELLAIALAVILINAFWPDTPTWVFIVGGFAMGVAVTAGSNFRHRLRRRRSTT